MPMILFAVVARGSTALSRSAICDGNFVQVADQVLSKISPENAKLTYLHSSFHFHYVSENRFVYLCITDDDLQRSVAFSFLADIKMRFTSQYNDNSKLQTLLASVAEKEFSPVLAQLMRFYNMQIRESGNKSVPQEISELSGIMVRNIDGAYLRGENLELLMDRRETITNDINVSLIEINRNCSYEFVCKFLIVIIFIALILVLLYVAVSQSCGYK